MTASLKKVLYTTGHLAIFGEMARALASVSTDSESAQFSVGAVAHPPEMMPTIARPLMRSLGTIHFVIADMLFALGLPYA